MAPAIARIKALVGKAPRSVTAGRGYGEAKVQDELHGFGVKNVVIPRKGRPAASRRRTEHGAGFRHLVKWRTGSEGRISYLKRRWGWQRSLLDGLGGAEIWCGMGVLAHNALKVAVLIEDKEATRRSAPVAATSSIPSPSRAGPDHPPGPPPTAEPAA